MKGRGYKYRFKGDSIQVIDHDTVIYDIKDISLKCEAETVFCLSNKHRVPLFKYRVTARVLRPDSKTYRLIVGIFGSRDRLYTPNTVEFVECHLLPFVEDHSG